MSARQRPAMTSTHSPPPPQPPTKLGFLPTLPNISSTISSILQTSSTSTPVAIADHDQASHSNDPNTLTSPATNLASYLPASVASAPMTAWFKKPATAKSAIKSPRAAGSRDQSPSKSVMFSSLSRDASSTEMERRPSQETTSDRSRKSKRSSKPKSSYSIRYAPPRSSNRHKIQVRARPLLQLHKIESRSRPRPEFELLPAAIFSSRLNKAIARFSPSKHGINPTDLAIVRAEKYHEHELSANEEDESRDILAIISGLSKGCRGDNKAKICLEHGEEWEAYRLPNGGYECITVDTHGLKRTVRWVPKRNTKSTEPTDESQSTRKFKFSTISANSRRHPVIANLSGISLDIFDVYSLPAPSARADSPVVSPMERGDSDPRLGSEQVLSTTDELRRIITSTAMFVALCEGWCPGYRTEDVLSRSTSQKSVISPIPAQKRNASLDNESVGRANSMRQALRSPSFFRTSSFKHESRPSSSSSSVVLDSKAIRPIPEAVRKTPITEQDSPRRARADTVSTVIVRDSPTQWLPTYDDETEDEAKDDPRDYEVKSQIGSDLGDKRRYSGTTIPVPAGENEARSRATTLASSTNLPEKRFVSSSTAHSEASDAPGSREKEKKLSTASTIVAEETSDRNKLSGKRHKKRHLFTRILLCGLAK